jgi:hypothetical protein
VLLMGWGPVRFSSLIVSKTKCESLRSYNLVYES